MGQRRERHRLHVPRPIQAVLRTDLIWRLSGISYPTAIIATTGRYISPAEYFEACSERMKRILPHLGAPARLLEFGAGLGGNLVAVHTQIQTGYGIDINPFFTNIAKRLARKRSVTNIQFNTYDGTHLPMFDPLDAIFALGAFERIAKGHVGFYLSNLSEMLRPNGIIASYFLLDSAENQFGDWLLGTEAYSFWNREELGDIFQQCGLRLQREITWYGDLAGLFVLEKM